MALRWEMEMLLVCVVQRGKVVEMVQCGPLGVVQVVKEMRRRGKEEKGGRKEEGRFKVAWWDHMGNERSKREGQ